MAQHIRILSVLFIIFGILGLVFAATFFLVGAGTVATILSLNPDPNAQAGAAWIGGCLTLFAVLFGFLALPSIIAGWGLSQNKSWARILTIVIAVLSLPHFPVGTAIGIYALVIMFNDETRALLRS